MCTLGASSVIDLGPTDAAGDDEGGEGMREPRSTVTVADEDDVECEVAAELRCGRRCDCD